MQFETYAAIMVGGVEASPRVHCRIELNETARYVELKIINGVTLGPSRLAGSASVRFFRDAAGDAWITEWNEFDNTENICEGGTVVLTPG